MNQQSDDLKRLAEARGDAMSKYIFVVKAINTVPEAIAGAYGYKTALIEASSIEEALEKADRRWKRNEQFRFEYHYVGKE